MGDFSQHYLECIHIVKHFNVKVIPKYLFCRITMTTLIENIPNNWPTFGKSAPSARDTIQVASHFTNTNANLIERNNVNWLKIPPA